MAPFGRTGVAPIRRSLTPRRDAGRASALSLTQGPDRLVDSAQSFLVLTTGLAAFFAAGFFSTMAKELTLNFVPASALTTASRVSEPFFMATVTALALRSTSTLFTPAILARVSRTPEAQPPQVIPVTPTTYVAGGVDFAAGTFLAS